MDSSRLLLGWTWLRFKAFNLDERSTYLRHEGHKIKLKFMTPRQVSKDQHWLKDETEKERIEKEVIETAEGRENEEKEKEVEKKMMEILFFNVFSSTVCDVISRNKRINKWLKHIGFHVWKGSLFTTLYYAFGPLMSSKFVKHNAWNYLLLHMK